MEHIIPEILQLKGCEQPPQFHPEGDVFVHTRLMLSLLKDNPSIELVLSVLLHDIGKPATYSFDEAADRIRFNGHDKLGAEMSNQILRGLKFSNSIIENVDSKGQAEQECARSGSCTASQSLKSCQEKHVWTTTILKCSSIEMCMQRQDDVDTCDNFNQQI